MLDLLYYEIFLSQSRKDLVKNREIVTWRYASPVSFSYERIVIYQILKEQDAIY